MLIGQYEARLGAKNRVGFPKKFREELGDKLIVTQGFEKSLIIVSEKGWKALLEGTEGRPFTQKGAREVQRFILGGASDVALDDKGRFVLPEYLKNYAEAEEEIVFVGQSRYVEMWDKKRWNSYNAELAKNVSTVAERLSGDQKSE